MAVDIVAENALTAGRTNYSLTNVSGCGDKTNLGFAREFSVNIGETIHFSCTGTGTVLDIYRLGYYGGDGWRLVAQLTNTATAQPNPTVVPNSNGAVTCTAWSTTASWAVPSTATSGLYVGLLRNAALNNGSWIPFVVRDDAAEADIIYKTSDATWALAYNYYGPTVASPVAGKSVYGSGGAMGDITTRSHYGTYHVPIITRDGISQTYFNACETPMIRFLERNGYKVKYIACKDLDRDPAILDKGHFFLSNGHDEYWSKEMRENVEGYRDHRAGRSVFMAGNEVFWKIRYDATRDGMWCYKDTMSGPGAHVNGTPLDPVEWTGTWKDTRWPGHKGEWLLTGTDFRMNGVNDFDAVVQNSFGEHPVWGGSALVDNPVTFVHAMGFEADEYRPTQPAGSYALLAAYTRDVGNNRADDNGQYYNLPGSVMWGIVSQRYAGGGITVGFGTCQWSWCLDGVHDRGTGAEVNATAQQFIVNLFHDLGAAPATLMAGITLHAVNDLDEYGIDPTTAVMTGRGQPVYITMGDGRPVVGTSQGIGLPGL